ncbi:MAG: HIT family protein [Acidimicrobiales bacterium]|jgi:diadenosine tetraphosphate (Ap4A) HIT family hydrolase
MAGGVRHSPRGAQDRVMATTENECPFCDRIAMRRDLLGANSLCVAFYDAKPLNPGHVLIVPYRHEPDFLALLPEERNAILRMAAELRSQLDEAYRPDGFNLGVNVGGAAGQTIGHAHLHLIPRHWGDVPDPRGGIRCLIPERTRYWEAGERGDQR